MKTHNPLFEATTIFCSILMLFLATASASTPKELPGVLHIANNLAGKIGEVFTKDGDEFKAETYKDYQMAGSPGMAAFAGDIYCLQIQK